MQLYQLILLLYYLLFLIPPVSCGPIANRNKLHDRQRGKSHLVLQTKAVRLES